MNSIAIVVLCVLIVVLLAIDFVRARRRWRPVSTLDSLVLRRAFVCADCSGTREEHAAWCGRSERPKGERDAREVRGGPKRRSPIVKAEAVDEDQTWQKIAEAASHTDDSADA